jgi:1-acyl-sn-glycerol-3-phosphate acyltransferase
MAWTSAIVGIERYFHSAPGTLDQSRTEPIGFFPRPWHTRPNHNSIAPEITCPRFILSTITYIRSALYNVLFYLVTALFLVLGSPLLLAPRPFAMMGLIAHAKICCWLLRAVAGTTLEVRGREHLPHRAALIASKHQSAWDTFGLIPLLHDPALVMKAELGRIPLYGWFARKFGMILIPREKRAAALKQLLREAKARASDGRHILIFPEGTRMAPGAPPDYKAGISALYEALDIPCIPIALNTGVFWPRRGFIRRPGTMIVEFLPALPAGLPRQEFNRALQDRIEAATTRLVAEALSNRDAIEYK